ncbi:dehydrogenase/reductase SDR family member 1-like [Styela clava]
MVYQRICIVTGGSRGIGRGIALELAKHGFTVYITGRNMETLQAVANEVGGNESGGRIHPIECDHANDEQVDKMFETIKHNHQGRLDLLVNNASSSSQFITNNSELSFWDQPDDSWEVFNNVGLRNNFRCTVLASRLMIKKRKGLIINISSVGSLGYMLTPLYGIGKNALDRMARDCAVDLKKYNVAFISLWPFAVKTEYAVNAAVKSNSRIHTSKEALYFLEHGESVEFVGKVVVFLLEDKMIMSKTGKTILTADVAREHALLDDGKRPVDFFCLKDLMNASGFHLTAMLIPEFIRLPRWMVEMILYAMTQEKNESTFA